MSGKFSRDQFDRNEYEQSLASFRHVLDNAEVVGWPKRNAELYELGRLITKYPTEARRLLDSTGPPADPAP
jgi:hypothetical protein